MRVALWLSLLSAAAGLAWLMFRLVIMLLTRD